MTDEEFEFPLVFVILKKTVDHKYQSLLGQCLENLNDKKPPKFLIQQDVFPFLEIGNNIQSSDVFFFLK